MALKKIMYRLWDTGHLVSRAINKHIHYSAKSSFKIHMADSDGNTSTKKLLTFKKSTDPETGSAFVK